jgi:type II secretion system protein N
MSAASVAGEPELPRWARRFAIPLGCLVLTTVFFVAGLPRDRIGAYATSKIQAATGAQVTIRELGLGLSVPPALSAEGVSLRFGDAAPVELTRARVRPAWSLSWLRLRPAFVVSVAGPLGEADGTLTIGDEPGFDGSVARIDLAKLPLGGVLQGASVDGTASATGDLRRTAAGPRGELRLEARNGSLSLPNLPIALPYASLRGTLRFTDAHALELEAVAVDGPLVAGTVSGSIGHAAIANDAAQGLRLGPDGSADVTLSGSLAAPSVR